METQTVNTVIVGGGQAGLATSYFLKQRNHDHVVLEQATKPGYAWREQRWDSFTWVTPNWTIKLPGMAYDGDDPNGYMHRDEIVRLFERYVEHYELPVQFSVMVQAVEPNGKVYRVRTNTGDFRAANVVIATGMFQMGKVPNFAIALPPDIKQLRTDEYRNPDQLPPGAVLVVGSGQSGCQITEELVEHGRKVYLCVSGAPRFPRRYRGKDAFEWAAMGGMFEETVDTLSSPHEKYAPNPLITGKDGGHSLNLHQLARDGVTLLGRLQTIEDGKLKLAPDLKASLTKSDKAEEGFVRNVDMAIERNGIPVPPETIPQLRDGYDQPEIQALDLVDSGISTVIWTLGFSFDYSLVKLPVLDDDGYPIQKRGVTVYPGLYFVGMHWLHKRKSTLVLGVGEDAAYIAEHIVKRNEPV